LSDPESIKKSIKMSIRKNYLSLKRGLFTLIVVLNSLYAVAGKPVTQSVAKVINFEAKDTYKAIISIGGQHKIDNQVQMMGRPSLSWNWNKNGELSLPGEYELDYNVTTSGIIYAPVFVLYLYNEKASDQHLKFVLTDDVDQEMEFSFGMNFTGWRTAWIRYTDMEGTMDDLLDKKIKGIKVIAPDKGSGCLKFGPLIPNAKTYQALPMADIQVPYLMDGEDEHRGPGVSQKHLDVLNLQVNPVKASEKELSDLNEIELRLTQELFSQYNAEQEQKWGELQHFYKSLKTDDKAQGLYISFMTERHVIPSTCTDMHSSSVNFQNVGDFLNDLAILYHKSDHQRQKQQIEEMFSSVLNQMKYQGWVAGHARGTIHNVGYKVKTFMSAIFLMREVLEERKLLNDARELCQWLTNARECLLLPYDANLDYFHTFAREQLITHLLSSGNNEKVAWIRNFSKFISLRMAMQTHDEKDGFKYDGTAFHHYGHYPDYAIGGLHYASMLIYIFRGSEFAVTREAHENVTNALLQMRIYANKYNFPNALTGRHPFTKNFTMKSPQVESAFHYLTKAGSVDGKDSLNKIVSAAYLRLYPEKDMILNYQLMKAGVTAENAPTGHWPMNNAANSIHRRNEWMLSIKGYSKYVWNAENWQNANRYGVFHSHGAIDILLGRGLKSSGFQEKGWDWSRLPGTTALNVPYEILNASITGSVNRRSAEVFAGGVQFDGRQGAFGMVLNDVFFNLKARKSIFCFDNRIICLGSNISSWNQNYDTETTLFQNGLSSNEMATNWNGQLISEFPYTNSMVSDSLTVNVIADNVGNTYFVRKGDLVLNRSVQHSRYQNNGKHNQGKFVTAVLNHGRHPKNAIYEYAILVQAEDEEVSKFQNSLNTVDPAYEVLQHDAIAHAVRDRATEITACIVYEAGEIAIDCIKEISHAALFMVKGDEQTKRFSVCQPDLKWDYERPVTSVYLKLAGEWHLEGDNDAQLVYCKEDVTFLKIKCEMGKVITFSCKRKG